MKKNIKKVIKNDLTRYLTNEEGKVVKGNVVKTALALGILTAFVQESAALGHGNNDGHQSHNNLLHNSATQGTYHASGHISHGSHGSHGSHASW